MPHRQYRSLEQECRVQAVITTDRKVRQELEKMEREYKVIADWLELRHKMQQAPRE
jgi:hypothetical protein